MEAIHICSYQIRVLISADVGWSGGQTMVADSGTRLGKPVGNTSQETHNEAVTPAGQERRVVNRKEMWANRSTLTAGCAGVGRHYKIQWHADYEDSRAEGGKKKDGALFCWERVANLIKMANNSRLVFFCTIIFQELKLIFRCITHTYLNPLCCKICWWKTGQNTKLSFC